MQINPEIIRNLRERTGAGIMDCKNSLIETNGDLEAAIIYLREKGLADAVKKSNRVASEGLIGINIDIDQKRAAIMEVNCETDFVSRNSEFKKLVDELTKKSLGESNIVNNSRDLINLSVIKLKEKIAIRRYFILEDGDFYGAYIHTGGSVGALVEFRGLFSEFNDNLAKNIAMQVVALSPSYLSRSNISSKTIETERNILKNQIEQQNKPIDMIERIINGRMEKYYSESCLLEQKFIRDPNITVEDMIRKAGLEISKFIRFKVGEEMKNINLLVNDY